MNNFIFVWCAIEGSYELQVHESCVLFGTLYMLLVFIFKMFYLSNSVFEKINNSDFLINNSDFLISNS